MNILELLDGPIPPVEPVPAIEPPPEVIGRRLSESEILILVTCLRFLQWIL
jgi:hypothetical protein